MPAARRVAVPLRLTRAAARPATGAVSALGGATMGTTWSVKAVMAESERDPLRQDIAAALDLVVAQMSTWLPSSDICRFNAAHAGETVALPAEFHAVLSCGLRIARESDGAYDPAIGRLVELWGFGPSPRRATPPAANAIKAAHDAGGWRRLTLAADGALRQPGGLQLDLSSIAKGFAVDLVAARLRERGLGHFLVEIGGELLGAGVKPDGTPWWVGVEHAADPNAASREPLVVALHGLAVATSGIERAFMHDGRCYSHTIDPRNGWPVASGLACATVLHASCMEADAYATALMVMGADRAQTFAAAHDLAARIVTDDGTEHISPALAAMLA